MNVSSRLWTTANRSARTRRHAAAWTAVLAAALLATSCGKADKGEEAEAEGPTHVLVEPVVRGAMDHVITADAVLYPVNQSNVTAKISAPLKRALVNRGDHVRAGQLLAELESADLASAAEEAKQLYEQAQSSLATTTGATAPEDKAKAEADVRAAQQSLDTAKHFYESRVALEKEGALAQRQVEEAKLTMVQAQSQLDSALQHMNSLSRVGQREAARGATAQVNAARARYDSALTQLSYARVVSPINGVVSDRPVYPGEMAAAGSPLVSIVDISQVVARANIPVQDAAAIHVGRPARITTPTGDVAGKVVVVSPATSPNSTTVEVWVQTDNPGEKLKPGATVKIAIIAETIQNTIIVPGAALLNSDTGTPKVVVVDADLVAHERMVSVGIRQGDRVQIIGGVQEGDKVVISGGLGLEDKAKVVIDQPKSEDDDEDDDADDPGKDSDSKGGKASKDGKK